VATLKDIMALVDILNTLAYMIIYSMVSRLDPDEEAALSVATLEDIMALADILSSLISMTYLFYGV
jgi:hypothetical protein